MRKAILLLVFGIFTLGLQAGGALSRIRRKNGVQRKIEIRVKELNEFFDEHGKILESLFPVFPDNFRDPKNSKHLSLLIITRINRLLGVLEDERIFYINQKKKALDFDVIKKVCLLALKLKEIPQASRNSLLISTEQRMAQANAMKNLVGRVLAIQLNQKILKLVEEIRDRASVEETAKFLSFSLGVW
ncbi:hypothetical protein KAT92_02115 [Candidatus Babeliales bacterium]|nr:hypothetical protein [Candidatus Babeliales bacterium]